MSDKIEIGYLCGRGHYIFYADPEGDDPCQSHRTAGIYVEKDSDIEFYEPYEEKDEDGFVYFSSCGYSKEDYVEEFQHAQQSLGEMIGVYRRT